jgi:hypothetical protein
MVIRKMYVANSGICDRSTHLEDAKVDGVENKELSVEAQPDPGTLEIPGVLYYGCQ